VLPLRPVSFAGFECIQLIKSASLEREKKWRRWWQYAPGLVEQLGRAASRLLEIDVGERLPVGVADDEAGLAELQCPSRRSWQPGFFLRLIPLVFPAG
jgi:hypothetical protein